MKRNFLFLLSFVMILMTACSQNDEITDEVNNSALAKAEMTYEQYLKGYTLEELSTPKDELTPTKQSVTIADDELMKLLQDSLKTTYSKTRVSTRGYNYIYPFMGVFKVNTCGNYPELQIFMDCEDGGSTNINGGVTDSRLPGTDVSKGRNITMRFCLVMNDQNDFIPHSTGALYFGGGSTSLISENGKRISTKGIEFVERWHDNEDHSNINSITITDPLNRKEYGLSMMRDDHRNSMPAPTWVGHSNSFLTWIFNWGMPIKLFNPGFSYGVLTNFKSQAQIRIEIDDENGKNSNYVNLIQWGNTGWHKNLDFNGKNLNDTQFGDNTVYYVKIVN